MANGIIEGLKQATEEVQKVAEMEWKEQAAYKKEVASQFYELQKAVHSIISEERVILENFDWKWIEKERSKYCFEVFIQNKAELFAHEYGFSMECVKRILESKNADKCKSRIFSTSYFMLVPKK